MGPKRKLSFLAVTLTIAPRAIAADGLEGGFDLERFKPTPAGDHFEFVPQPTARLRDCNIKACWGAATARAVYAHAPLKLVAPDGEGTSEVQASYVRLHLGAAWMPFEAFKLSFDIPLSLYQGDLSSLPGGYSTGASRSRLGRAPDTGDIGDIRMSARVRGWDCVRFLGLQFSAFLPTGDRERLMNDRIPSFEALALMQWGEHDVSQVTVAFAAGYRNRPPVAVFDKQIGGGGEVGAAVSWLFPRPFAIQGEVWIDQLNPDRSPLGLLAAVGPRVTAIDRRFWFTALGLAGLTTGPGVPQLGATLSVTYVPPLGPGKD